MNSLTERLSTGMADDEQIKREIEEGLPRRMGEWARKNRPLPDASCSAIREELLDEVFARKGKAPAGAEILKVAYELKRTKRRMAEVKETIKHPPTFRSILRVLYLRWKINRYFSKQNV